MTRRAGSLGVSLTCALVLTACGSTVQLSGDGTSTGAGPGTSSALGGELAIDPAQPASTASGDVGDADATVPGAPTRVGSSSRAEEAQVPAGKGAVATPLAGGSSLGPGVDAKTITIGLTIQSNNATVSSLASAYNVQLADNQGAYEALVKHVNGRGGIAGRTLRPVYHRFDSTNSTAGQIGQAACSAFTEDDSVFAALDAVSVDSFNTCMQQRGRLMLHYGLFLGSTKTWDRYHNIVAADGLPYDDAGRLLAEHLARVGFLSRSTKLGAIVRSSDDLTDAYRRGFLPALARAGLSVAEAHFIRDAQSASEISGYTSDISSAVLKFRSEGIDRVVFFDTGSYSALVFSQNAEQQGYRPRYGFSSLNSIVTLQGEGSAAPQEQMVGAQGVSWETGADGLTKERTADAQRCLAILKEEGISATDAGTEASYLKTCQTFFLFTAVAERAGRDLSRDTFIAALERLGSGFRSTNTWNGLTRFGARDHSGISVFRPFAYDAGCSCFAVNGGVRPVDAS